MGGIKLLSKLLSIYLDEEIIQIIIRCISTFFQFESLGDLTEYLDMISTYFTTSVDRDLFNQCLDSYLIFSNTSEKNTQILFDKKIVKKIINFILEDQRVFSILTKIAEKDKFQKNLVDEGILPYLFKITGKSKEIELKQNASKILALLCLDDENVKVLINDEYLENIFDILKESDAQILRFGGIIVGNLARSDNNCAKIIENQGVDLLLNLLTHKETEVKGNACFAITNLIRLSKKFYFYF